jgi:hypothetical protein
MFIIRQLLKLNTQNMKNTLLFGTVLFFTIVPNIYATSGACSSHGGVNCSAGADTDGSVICYDGWKNSSVAYSSMEKCGGSTASFETVTPVQSPVSIPSDTLVDISNSPYQTAIDYLYEKKIVSGYADSTFKPNNLVNRAEMLKIVLEARKPVENSEASDECFPDVQSHQWFAKYICYAKKENYIGGYPDGTFKPEKNVSYVEALKIAMKVYNISLTPTEGQWYETYISTAKNMGIDLGLTPSSLINRGQMAELVYKIINL